MLRPPPPPPILFNQSLNTFCASNTHCEEKQCCFIYRSKKASCTIVEIKHEALLFFSEVAFIWLLFLFVPSSPAEFLRRCKGLNNGCWGD